MAKINKPNIKKRSPSLKSKSIKKKAKVSSQQKKDFILLSTWNHGLPANEEGKNIFRKGGSPLDAIVAGCKITEGFNADRTVGLCGWPDREGKVTLDAAVMVDDSRAGSVSFVKGVAHPIELARIVMEKTPHVMLVG